MNRIPIFGLILVALCLVEGKNVANEKSLLDLKGTFPKETQINEVMYRKIPIVARLFRKKIALDTILQDSLKYVTIISGYVLLLKAFAAISRSIDNFSGIFSQQGLPANIPSFLPSNCSLNIYELEVLSSVVDPKGVQTDMSLVGGLKIVKRALLECIYDPLTLPNVPHSALMRPVRGVLLFGPPGKRSDGCLH